MRRNGIAGPRDADLELHAHISLLHRSIGYVHTMSSLKSPPPPKAKRLLSPVGDVDLKKRLAGDALRVQPTKRPIKLCLPVQPSPRGRCQIPQCEPTKCPAVRLPIQPRPVECVGAEVQELKGGAEISYNGGWSCGGVGLKHARVLSANRVMTSQFRTKAELDETRPIETAACNVQFVHNLPTPSEHAHTPMTRASSIARSKQSSTFGNYTNDNFKRNVLEGMLWKKPKGRSLDFNFDGESKRKYCILRTKCFLYYDSKDDLNKVRGCIQFNLVKCTIRTNGSEFT